MASRVIRELLVRLGVTVTPTSRADIKAMEDALERVKRVGTEAAGALVQVSKAAAVAVAGAAAALGKLAIDTGQQSIEIERQARLLLLTRREYQEWLYVSQQAGATQRDLADTMLQVNDATQRALGGSKEMNEAFAGIGLNVASLKGQNPSQLLESIAAAIEKTSDRSKALGVVSRLLGEESGRKFGPLLMSGVAAMRAMRQEAEALGVVMDDRAMAAAKEAAVQWRRLTSVTRGLRSELGAALAPMVTRVLRGTLDWVRANRELISDRLEEWVRRLRVAIEKLHAAVMLVGGWDVVFRNVATGLGLLLLLANLGKVQALLGALEVAVAAFGAASTATLATFGIALGPLLFILAAIAYAIGAVVLVFEDWYVWLIGGNSAVGALLDAVESVIPAFGDFRDLVWAIVEAVIGAWSNLGLFANALLTGLAPALQVVDAALAPVLLAMRELVDLWQRANEFVGSGLRSITAAIESDTYFSGLQAQANANALQGQISGSVAAQAARAAGAINNAVSNINNADVSQVNNFFGGGPETFSDALGGALRRARTALQGGLR